MSASEPGGGRAEPAAVELPPAVRGQLLDPSAWQGALEKFGLATNLDAQGRPSAASATSGNYHWHTDKSYHRVPSLMTILHAVELPGEGGETEFANTALAYAALGQRGPSVRRRAG